MTRQHTVRPQTRDKPTTDTAVWGDSRAGSRPAGWTTQYTRPRQRWLRTSAAGVRYRRELALRHGIRKGRQSIAAAAIPRTRGGPSVMGQPEKSRNRRNTASQPPTAETLTHMGDQHFNDVVRVKARLPTQGVLRAQLFRITSPIHRMSRTPNSSPPRGQCGPARRD